MGDIPDLENWRSYPRSLSARGYNVYGYDCDSYVDQLDQDVERLFVKGPSVCLKVLDFSSAGNNDRILTTLQELQPYLEHPRPSGTTRLMLVPQEGSSWGKLQITQECILKLLTALQVFPAAVDVLRAFGQKTAATDESYSGFYFQDNQVLYSTECAYSVKFPEQHGRAEPKDPWSLRQMGVYHQRYNDGTTIIVFNPSRPFLRRLKQATTAKEPLTAWSIQTMALSAAMDNWRWYISDLEKRYTTVKINAQLASVTNHTLTNNLASIHFEDTQDMQVLQDKLSQSLHHMTANNTVLVNVQARRAPITGGEVQEEDSFISTLMVSASMETTRIKNLLSRAEGTQALAQAFLDFTCLESLRSNSKIMTELTRSSKKETELLLDLSMKASRDNDILKTLALLGLIYLPATLISSIMGMSYIKIPTSNKKTTLVIEKELWIFLALVVFLLIVTLGSYCVWIRKKEAQRRKRHKKLAWRQNKHMTW